ncbi:MAG TPA: transglycosylase SLT domain-containing protein [Acidobacteriota bacterium]
MMQKNPVKKFAAALSLLAVLAVVSLLAQMVQSNRNYESSLAHIRFLAAHLADLHGRLLQSHEEQAANEKKYERIDLLEYKNATFQKKFPEFSHIVDVAFRKARLYGLSPNLVLAVMQVESAFNPLAVSSAGAFGLMQVRYAVWKDELAIDRNRIFDVEYNIDLGLRILKQYQDIAGGNMRRALFLYNNGYKYNNEGYVAKVNSSIYNRDLESGKVAGVSQ